MAVRVRLFAAAREAFGSSEAEVCAGTVRDVCGGLVQQAEPERRRRLSAVLAMSALVSSGVRYRAADDAELHDGAEVDVLPPFAGG